MLNSSIIPAIASSSSGKCYLKRIVSSAKEQVKCKNDYSTLIQRKSMFDSTTASVYDTSER